MVWSDYWSIVRRRWWIVAAILVLDLLAGALLFVRSSHAAGYQACQTLYVADVSAPSLVAAPDTTLQGLGQLLSGETAANFFADDILDVAQSRRVANYLVARAGPRGLALGSLDGAISGSRRDRTVDLCVSNGNPGLALRAARNLSVAMTAQRSRFVGAQMAKRTFVSVISSPTVSTIAVSRSLTSLSLRLILGALVAFGAALLWDVFDPGVRDRRDMEQSLGAPVLASGTL